MPLIHALLILSYWPLPYGASSENPSRLYCGAAVHKALALGLHRPAFLADFVNWSLPNDKAILTRQKTWIACFIVNQTYVPTYLPSHIQAADKCEWGKQGEQHVGNSCHGKGRLHHQ